MKRSKRDSKRKRGGSQVRIGFTNKPVTAWGGVAALVGRLLAQVGFRDWVERALPIEERSPNARGVYEKVLAQFLTVLCGGSRFWHLSWWGHGREVILAAFGVKWLPQAGSTLTRFWGKLGARSAAERLGARARELAAAIVRQGGVVCDDLNVDSTVLTRYGGQEGAKRGYNPKKRGRPSHHPLLAFLASGYVVNLWNRQGDTSSGQSVVEFFDQTVAALGPGFTVREVHADTGFYQVEFIQHLESQPRRAYVLAVPLREVLQRQIYAVADWQPVEGAAGLAVGEFHFQHADEKWDRPRRYVVVRQSIRQRPNATGKQPKLFRELEEWDDCRFSLYLTNDETSPPVEVWRRYRPRANDENCLKDLKEGYGLAAFNLHNFWATEAVLVVIALVFHNLIHHLNRTILHPRGPRPQLRTLRGQHFILPAVLGRGGRRTLLRLALRGRSGRARFGCWLAQIDRLDWDLNGIAVDG